MPNFSLRNSVSRLIFSAFVIFLAGLSHGCGGGGGSTESFNLTGTAANSRERPLSGLNLTLLNLDGSLISRVETRADGSFSISNIDSVRTVLQARGADGALSNIEIVFTEGVSTAAIFLQSINGFMNSTLDADPSNPASTGFSLTGNIDSSSRIIPAAQIPAVPAPGDSTLLQTTLFDLLSVAVFSTSVQAIDSLGELHTISLLFFHTGESEFTVRAYVADGEVSAGSSTPENPRFLPPEVTLQFGVSGTRANGTFGLPDTELSVPWSNGAAVSEIEIGFPDFSSVAAPSGITSIQSRS